MLGIGQIGSAIGRIGIATPIKGGGVTVLRRETDGTVTVLSLARTWTPNLTREEDGTVTVS